MAINKRATKKRRLKFIKDDIQDILDKLSKLKVDLETEGEDGVSLITHISNIQIACNLNDNEPDGWKLKTEI